MKKIIIIMTTEYGKNGISSVVNNLYREIDKSGLKIDFVFPNEPDESMINQIFFNNGVYHVINNRMRRPLAYMIKLFKIVKNYDVIHVHGNSHTMFIELLVAKLAKVKKRITHAHSTNTNFPMINNILTKPFLWAVTDRIACGKDVGEFVYGQSEFFILKNGIKLDEYKFNSQVRKEYRKKNSFDNDDRILIQIGYFDGNKNQIFSVKLLNQLVKINNNYKLIFIGKGYENSEALSMVNQLNLHQNVFFFGERNDISEIMSMVDVLLLPSFYEGMPRVVIESQASDLINFVSSNVSQEINVSEKVSFFSLDEKLDLIARDIDNSFSQANKRFMFYQNEKLRKEGYDIEDVSKLLKTIYCKS